MKGSDKKAQVPYKVEGKFIRTRLNYFLSQFI
jgi:hypothetical protein